MFKYLIKPFLPFSKTFMRKARQVAAARAARHELIAARLAQRQARRNVGA